MSNLLKESLAPAADYASAALRLPHLKDHFSTIVISALAFQLLELVSGPISSFLFPNTYPALRKGTKKNWNVHVVSLVHALIIVPLALRTKLSTSTALETDRAFGWDLATGEVISISLGYFIWDTIQCCVTYTDFGFLAHAAACLAIYLNAFRPFLVYYGCTFLLWELSTPFLDIHWFLDKLGKTGGTLQLLNGITLITTFFGVRIVYGGVNSLAFFDTMNSISHRISTSVYVAYSFGNILLNILNWLWFFKMISALRKRFAPKEKAAAKSK